MEKLKTSSSTLKNFLTLKDLTGDEIIQLVDLSIELKNKKKQGIFDQRLKHKSIAVIFEKTSTRTRCATSVACIEEGAHAEFLGKSDIQMGKKESVKDTARVLGRMFDAIMFRGYEQKTLETLSEYSNIPVVNALSDKYHPTQIIADFMTIKERFGSLKGKKIAFLGDGNDNVCISLLIGAMKTGMKMSIGAPKEYTMEEDVIQYLKDEGYTDFVITEDPVEAVKDADVIYTDVWLSMGQEKSDYAKKKIKILQPYAVTTELMQKTGKKDTIFLHCLPATHENGTHIMEVTEEVFESDQSYVFDQAENRLHSIKAIFIALIDQ